MLKDPYEIWVFFVIFIINGYEIYFRIAFFTCAWFKGMKTSEKCFQNIQKWNTGVLKKGKHFQYKSAT